MRRIDLLLGIALILAVVLSAVGVATYEDDRLARFDVAWSVRSSEVTGPSASQTGGGTVETLVNVTTLNITEAAWTVTVTGAAARVQPVAILVEVVVPFTNETVTAEGTLPAGPAGSVDVPVTIHLAQMPNATRVTGPTLDAARDAVNATLSSTLGVGEWTIRTSLAPSAPGPLGAESFTIDVRATLLSYQADLTPETPEVSRG